MPPTATTMTATEPHIRHRITFATSRTLAYISILELGILWERTLRRARIPLKYSQGYNPRPRMHFAAPLPVGCGSEADLLDIWLSEPWTSSSVQHALLGLTPADLTVKAVTTVDERAPALAEQLVEAEYRVWVYDIPQSTLHSAVTQFRQAETWPMPRRGKRHRGKTYDLRPLVGELRVITTDGGQLSGLWMRLKARPGATGRPDEVLRALGTAHAARRCIRTRLILRNDAMPTSNPPTTK